MKTAKTELRRTLRLRQSALSADYVHAASDRIQGLVLSSSAYREAQSICLYLHMPYEPATDRILRQALADGKTVYVPKCVSRTEMLAVRIRDLSGMKPGAFGIPEPADITETRAAADLDLILVPCLSAAPDGRRLGHGAGYYDRFLAGAGLTGRAVCLCFRRMLCGEIPADDYDIRIPQIITE
ncbi:MAG: 5-formyltetrahydrofolate cyclo-ligase [Lachnospiraceae bacterium]|nr:5-formyltetrahydrofolate cyclo-ligase [Lachnospiraceae bacterium]